jgi:long-chain acyl-CoA synthetase
MGASASAPFDYDAELFAQKRIVAQPFDADAKTDGETPAYRCVDYDFKDGLVKTVKPLDDDDVPPLTMADLSTRAAKRFGDAKCFGTREYNDAKAQKGPYVWKTYKQVNDDVQALARGLLEIGIEPQDTVGICSANRVEWSELALGAYATSIINVALYDSLGQDAVEYIISHAECKVAACSKAKLPVVLAALGKDYKNEDGDEINTKCVKYVIQWDNDPDYKNDTEAVDEADIKTAEEHGVKLIGFSELLAKGRESDKKAVEPKPDDVAFYMYTSGTTGAPKGVILSHANIIACAAGGVEAGLLDLDTDDVHISYLPLAHIFETVVQAACFMWGSGVGFFAGNVRTLMEDIKILQPTIFCGVPRVFTKIYDTVMNGVRNSFCIKRYFVNKALEVQGDRVRRGEPLDPAQDEKVGAKIRDAMGLNRCKLIVTGAAPMPPYLMEFLKAMIAPKQGIIQGYGMTETAAAVCISHPKDHTMGHVGPPLPSAEVKLVDVPEMGYLSTNDPPTGEVVARGPSIFRGYYKNDKATKSTIINGWCHTGDIGRWNPNGTLSIIDRKKNMFKLAQGEYVASDKVESVIERATVITQCFIYGNSYKPFVVGVVVPDSDNFVALAKENGWWGSDDSPKLSDAFRANFKRAIEENYEEVRAALFEIVVAQAKERKLQGFERPREIHVVSEIDALGNGFTVDNDMLTPTFKKRRPFILRHYEQQLRDMYTKHGEAPKPDERW